MITEKASLSDIYKYLKKNPEVLRGGYISPFAPDAYIKITLA